ncbi:MAG: extracellular solute-binding protein [Ruminococcaceae bacterium]|nr:extracellular solute-binding protein [Oscillospiraceae bacterium]
MKKTKFQRVTAFVLALVFLLCSGVVMIGAEENDSVSQTTTDDIRELLNAISYNDYIHAEAQTGVDRATEDVVIDATKNWRYYKEVEKDHKTEQMILSQADAEVDPDAELARVDTYDGKQGLYVPATNMVSWTTDQVKEAARYYVEIEYYPIENKATAIERIFMINDKVPFAEARYMTMAKLWKNVYPDGQFEVPKDESAQDYLNKAKDMGIEASLTEKDGVSYIIYKMPEYWTADVASMVDEQTVRFFTSDIDRNEIRATLVQAPAWTTYTFKDVNGFLQTPFEFAITPDEDGKVTISMESVNEPVVISEIRLVTPEEPLSYEEYSEKYATESNGTETIKIEGEYFSATSSQTIYPVSDTASAITSPSSTSYTVLNTIGGDKWQGSGQWIEYTFRVGSSGRYQIATRYMQNVLDGMYTSRMLYIYSDGSLKEGEAGYYNGLPFEEAGRLQFDYSSDWQSGVLTDGTDEFSFYFKEGVTYTLRFEVTLGNMGDIVRRVTESLDSINSDYLEILKLTGTTPDQYRDYGFSRVMPDTMADLLDQAEALYQIAAELEAEAGEKSSMTATLEKAARVLNTMGMDDDEVAKNLEQLKTYIGNLGTWLSDAKTQPLILDYIQIQPEGAELPKAKANFWEAFSYEVMGFVKSFFRNYDRMGAISKDAESEEAAEVWIATGRDQMQVLRGLVNNKFTPQEGIPINLKLVAGGTLLPSILSGTGPDVYIGVGQGDVINYAIRGALMEIEDLEGYEEIEANFNEAAMMVLGIEDAQGDYHCYGLPETQSFSMMFIRKDVLAELGIEIPKTWDDVKEAIPVLQANNMEIGMSNDANIFLYQSGGELFADGGMRINLDSNVALESFNTMCDLFTMYSFPYSYDFANRFRTGEMPIGFAGYTAAYNQLKVFATEIEGLWGFYPMPGYADEETGKINNVAVSGVTAIVMITGCDNVDDAWAFMKWHSGAEFQVDYSNEMIAILGPSAKHPTANKEAIESLPWTADEYEQISYQFNSLASIPNYPGSYIVGRYTQFAFLDAYNSHADPATALQGYITTINKEITRKREEFGLETLDYVGQTLAQKRMAQAETVLEEIKESDSYRSEYDTAYNNAMDLIDGYLTEDYASLRAIADSLDGLNADLFGKPFGDNGKAVTTYLREAADALESYEAYK